MRKLNKKGVQRMDQQVDAEMGQRVKEEVKRNETGMKQEMVYIYIYALP